MSEIPQAPQHEMQLDKTHPSGAEEWFCPTCGRRLLMRWPPNYNKLVLEAGDEFAIHSGGKGGLRLGLPQVREAEEPLLSDELRAALEEVLKDIDFDDAPGTID